MKKKKLLIATGNDGKLIEIKEFFADTVFDFIGLKDLKIKLQAPEENADTVEGNAILKAGYYAEKTGLLALADDTGLFINELNGWPGVKTARVAKSPRDRRQLVLKKMAGLEGERRSAIFITAMALYNPEQKSVFVTFGKKKGQIVGQESGDHRQGFGYDPIFYIKEKKKTYAQMRTKEKNELSHRGRALQMMKYHLEAVFGPRNIVVPIGLIIKDGKILMQLRGDPHRKEHHQKWEFPGGKIEVGESARGNLKRELKEETGYDVEVIKLLQHVGVDYSEGDYWHYQIYFLAYVCVIKGGNGKASDLEVLQTRWVEPDKVLQFDLLGNFGQIYEKLLPELKLILGLLK